MNFEEVSSLEDLDKIVEDGKSDELLEDAISEEPEVKAEDSDIEAAPEAKEEVAESEIEAPDGLVKQILDDVNNQEANVEGETEQPAFDYKYKHQDEFFEFDDRVKSAIKSKEDEEYFRDLYTKSAAMDLMKKRALENESKYTEINTKYTSLNKDFEQEKLINDEVTTLLDGLGKGDAQAFDKLLYASGANKNTLEAMAARLLEHLDNPNGYERNLNQHQYQIQQQQMQQQQMQMQNSVEESNAAATAQAIELTLLDPEVSEVAKAVNKRLGSNDAFLNAIYNKGLILEQQGQAPGFDKMGEFVKSVANEYRSIMGLNAKAAPAQAPVKVAETRVVSRTELPNVSGGTGTPSKKSTIDSLDALEDLYQGLVNKG